MIDFQYVTLKEVPQYKECATKWFSKHWKIPVEAYLEEKTKYGWYLCLNQGEIIGGLGVIENDFHERKDLTPNICAVYTEKIYRKQGIAGKLLNQAVEDLRTLNISSVYLITDHIGFYERYSWEFYCFVKGDDQVESRIYIHR